MRESGILRAAVALLVIVGAVAAKEPLAECGSYFTKAQEEAFLHARFALKRAAERFAPDATAAPRGALAQDVGDIAVLSDSGIIGRTNVIDLSNTSLTFTPATPGYTVTTGGNTYDTEAAAAPRVALEDDDTRQLNLAFPFTYFGTTYSSIWLNSNGTLTFTRGDLNYQVEFGRLVSGPPAIAGLFSDLDPSVSSTGLRVLSEPGRFVATWDRVPLATGTTAHTVQIRIYSDNHIEFAYGSVTPANAIVGIVPGNSQETTLLDLTASNGTTLSTGLAELFTSVSEVDITYAAQRFYQTHNDAYDYLVFYNNSGVAAGPSTVAYEITVRSHTEGIGDFPVDHGRAYGSARRLQAVLNMGPMQQYPVNPDGIVQSRGVVGDTPLTILAHETGHLWLALTSVPHPTNPFAFPPMLGAGLAHWAFPFNSDASFMEGNQIADNGPAATPRYVTTSTVHRYSAMDQYLMGFRAPEEVPPTFAVLGSGISNSRAPQTSVTFNGTRLDIGINDVIAASGRRTPDSTVAQRHYRLAFVLLVPENSDLSPGSPTALQIATIDEYRRRFEAFFAEKTDFRGTIDTSLRRASTLSLHPHAGVILGAQGRASISIATPAEQALTYTLATPNSVIAAPASVTIPQGQSRIEFNITGTRSGIEELLATPSDARYHATRARVQVEAASNLRVAIAGGDRQTAVAGQLPEPIVARVVDNNKLPYSNVRLTAIPSSGTSVNTPTATTDDNGQATFRWTTTAGSYNALRVSIDGVASSTGTAVAPGLPAIEANGVVNAASFTPRIAPNSFVTLFGGSLTDDGTEIGDPPFPDLLSGAEVYIDGAPAALSFASDFQINFITPANLATRTAHIVVATSRGVSDPYPIEVQAQAPGIFYEAGTGNGAILHAGTATRPVERPARSGDVLEIYCTGLGANPATTATIGGRSVEVLYGGASYLTGLQQVNIRVPSGLSSGVQDLKIAVNGVESNTVKVHIGQ